MFVGCSTNQSLRWSQFKLVPSWRVPLNLGNRLLQSSAPQTHAWQSRDAGDCAAGQGLLASTLPQVSFPHPKPTESSTVLVGITVQCITVLVTAQQGLHAPPGSCCQTAARAELILSRTHAALSMEWSNVCGACPPQTSLGGLSAFYCRARSTRALGAAESDPEESTQRRGYW